MKRAIALWSSAALYAVLITYLSHQPSLRLPAGLPDWLLHGIEFAGLGALVAGALSASHGRLGLHRAVWGAAGCAAFGVLDELHQSFVPGRTASFHDVVADATGATLALAAFTLISSLGRGGRRHPEIVLIGRTECHLCDEAESVLNTILQRRGLGFVKIDVDSSEDLKARYGEEVPVVLIEGRKVFKYRVDPGKLRRKLDSIQRREIR